MRVLVTGWFSYSDGHATAGDLLSAEVVCGWLNYAAIPYDIAVTTPFTGGIPMETIDPQNFTHVIFVCGPFGGDPRELQFLKRFAQCRLIGLNLSMAHPPDTWNPFDFLLERDSPARTNPDFVFAAPERLVPVAGICLVENYAGADTERANQFLRELLESREIAAVEIDTRLDVNRTGFRLPVEIESAIARVDVMLTTRLHGLSIGLKYGVPVIAVDPEPGGAKILRQARSLDWPVVFTVDQLQRQALHEALDYCLMAEARQKARAVARVARERLAPVREEVLRALTGGEIEERFRRRGERPQSAPKPTATSSVPTVLRPVLRFIRGAAASVRAAIEVHRVPHTPAVAIRTGSTGGSILRSAESDSRDTDMRVGEPQR